MTSKLMRHLQQTSSSDMNDKERVALLEESGDTFSESDTSVDDHAKPFCIFKTSFSNLLVVALVVFNLALMIMSAFIIFSPQASADGASRVISFDVRSLRQPNQYEGLLGDPHGFCAFAFYLRTKHATKQRRT